MGMLIREAQHEIDKFPAMVSNMAELQRRKELKQEIEGHRQGMIHSEVYIVAFG